jgi:hypothetical protein
MNNEPTFTPDQMMEWLDLQMGIEQSRGPWTDRTREHDVPFYRLKAIRDFIKKHKATTMEPEEYTFCVRQGGTYKIVLTGDKTLPFELWFISPDLPTDPDVKHG